MKPITATMVAALDMAREHNGKLIRFVGGYWSFTGATRDHNGNPVDHVGSSTVQGLVARGRMEYSDWKDGRAGHFPIEATLKDDPT